METKGYYSQCFLVLILLLFCLVCGDIECNNEDYYSFCRKILEKFGLRRWPAIVPVIKLPSVPLTYAKTLYLIYSRKYYRLLLVMNANHVPFANSKYNACDAFLDSSQLWYAEKSCRLNRGRIFAD